MRKERFFGWMLVYTVAAVCGYGETTAERLGYSANDKLLIVHADDIGMSHTVNVASMDALNKGIVSSGSIMVPCPWFMEIVRYSQENPDICLGLHLTLTSEWKNFRWRPLAALDKVKGLIDPEGYMFRDVRAVYQSASAEEVEAELRVQIEHALASGLKPTHMDSHMGTIYYNPEYLQVALKLSDEYNIQFMMFRPTRQIMALSGGSYNKELFEALDKRGIPMLDALYSIKDTPVEKSREFYQDVIRNLEPGISEIIIHLADDSAEIRAISNSWRQRVADYEIFTDPEMKAFIDGQGVKLVTWRDLQTLWEQRVK